MSKSNSENERIDTADHWQEIVAVNSPGESAWERAVSVSLIIPPKSGRSLKEVLQEIEPVKSNLPGTTLDRLLADRG